MDASGIGRAVVAPFGGDAHGRHREACAAVWHGRADERLLDTYEAERRPQAIEHINAMTARNKKLMEERDPAVRQAALDELRAIAADPARSYAYLLETSMIGPLRRSGLIG